MSKVKVSFLCILSFIFLNQSNQVSAQTDSLKLSFGEAEKLFLQNNLSLIAQKYNVNAADALIRQAALWDNPTLNTEQNLYDNTHKFFNHENGNGQVYLVLSQVFKTAGKRGKQVQLAKDDAKIQQASFDDLMRNLRYNLRIDFSEAARLNAQSKLYNTEIAALNTLADAEQKSYKSGNTSFKEAVRIKALLFGLQAELTSNNQQLLSLETELKTLLAVDPHSFIAPEEEEIHPDVLPQTDNLIAKALTQRADYMMSALDAQRAKDNLVYQKSLAVPDVSAGIVYDRINSYAPHYFGLQIGLPIPLFNRNQGNIKAARFDIKSGEASLKNAEAELKNSVVEAVGHYNLSAQMLAEQPADFYRNYDQLFKAMLKSYQQRQISLIEFVDFFDSYKDTRLKIIEQQYNLQKAAAELNYAAGSTVVNP